MKFFIPIFIYSYLLKSTDFIQFICHGVSDVTTRFEIFVFRATVSFASRSNNLPFDFFRELVETGHCTASPCFATEEGNHVVFHAHVFQFE